MAIDWLMLKNEYITTKISLRKLAEKHSVSFSTLEKRARKEAWASERTATCDKIEAKVRQKTVAAVASHNADRIVRLLSIGDKLAGCLDRAAGELDRQTAKRAVKVREIEYGDPDAKGRPTREVVREDVALVDIGGLPIDRPGLRQLAAALKDLRDVAQTGAAGEDDAALKKARELLEGVPSAID